MSWSIYATSADHINHHPYTCECLPHTAEQYDVVVDGVLAPMYRPMDHEVMQRTKKTIYQLIDLHNSGERYRILTDEDLLSITSVCVQYMKDNIDVAKHPEYASFLKKMIPFQRTIFRSLARAINHRHPEWQQTYMNQDSGLLYMARMFLQATGEINKYAIRNDPVVDVIERLLHETPSFSHPEDPLMGYQQTPEGHKTIQDYLPSDPRNLRLDGC